jgi:RNase P subunit RPR2
MDKYYGVCPNTKKVINTGLEMDEQTYSFSIHEIVDVKCKQCGESHRFPLSDLFTPVKTSH